MKKKDIIDYVKSNNIKTFDEFKSKNLELFIFAHNNRLLSGLGIKDKYPKTYFNGFKLEKEVSPAPSNESAASKEKVIKKKTTKKTEKRGRPKKNSKQCQQFNRLDDDVDKNRINHYKYLYSFKIDYPHMIHKNAELSECLDDTIKDKRSLLFFLNKNGIKKYIDILGMLNDEELFFLALKINVFGSSRKHNIKTTYYEVKTGHVPCSVETFLKNSNMNKVDMDICKYIYKTKITFRKLKKDLLYKKIINIYDIRLFYSFLEHKSKFFKFKNHRTSKTTYFQDHLISTYFKGKRNTDIYSYFIYKRNSIPKSMRLQPKYFREKYGIIGVRKHMYGKGKYKEKSREELKELISSFDGYRSEFIKKYKTDWSRIRKDQELLLFYQSEIKKKKNQERAEESYHQEIITKIKDRLNVKIINEYSIPNRRRVDLLIYIEGKKSL